MRGMLTALAIEEAGSTVPHKIRGALRESARSW